MGEIDVNLVQRNIRQAHQLKVTDHRCYGYRTIKSCLEYLKIPVLKAPLLISPPGYRPIYQETKKRIQ